MMYNVLVTCSAGMSTSMLVQKVKNEAEKQGVNLKIEAVSITEGKTLVQKHDYDLLLLGPQVAFMQKQMEEFVDGRMAVKVINQADYGMLRGDKVLQDIVETIEQSK
ncbi:MULTISPECIES: PTS sugar transporter subunit IIB [Shouchella]|uniref:PTS sugar transporter subunit IIB n=2 Tax=Shouchella TaxID=2893057 RepID=A0A268RY31_SHOCL|nr:MULTISPECIES: PTS sugar transporter subunit IIB [Shouchella]PAD42183.1 PTS sugar transporter subunit IIB [Bacillus sp. 7520-S]SPU18729.1 phosphotransferase system lactose/cellobiose-specific IIB subunit [Niallia circulans]AST95456.1 hypothetical protein BC8716_05480 [Shouchella clausii]MBU8598027.1 PTS sugar transporter subunit IIB [Shouchella clausii]MCM3550457.1 PTS sugar transporter subunit IIB [Shouchella clausii]